jgi:hydroxypyruvate isomerase
MSEPSSVPPSASSSVSRRRLLQAAGATAAGAALASSHPSLAAETKIVNKRIRQSIVQWCFQKHFDLPRLCKVAVELGCESIELVDPKDWPTLKEHGLVCAIAGSHGFEKGMNNPEYHAMCIDKMRAAIDACAAFGYPNVITFTGFAEKISAADGIKNCVAGYKKIIGHAEKQKVNLCLEMLNTRDPVEMKGHPGYQGDHTEYCMDIIKQVGSGRMKLLFDVYHVQIMDGDVIRRIHECGDAIAHVHTAGNPGRAELDNKQEINYPPIMQALLDIGYKGFVGQEFIPTRDALAGLREACALCDV